MRKLSVVRAASAWKMDLHSWPTIGYENRPMPDVIVAASKIHGLGVFFELPVELQLEYLPLLNPWFIDEHREKVDALKR